MKATTINMIVKKTFNPFTKVTRIFEIKHKSTHDNIQQTVIKCQIQQLHLQSNTESESKRDQAEVTENKGCMVAILHTHAHNDHACVCVWQRIKLTPTITILTVLPTL